MIGCDNDLCPIEWFHFSCVQLNTKPKGKWYCPRCRGDRPTVMKPKAQFLKELERYNKEKEEKAWCIEVASANHPEVRNRENSWSEINLWQKGIYNVGFECIFCRCFTPYFLYRLFFSILRINTWLLIYISTNFFPPVLMTIWGGRYENSNSFDFSGNGAIYMTEAEGSGIVR